MPGGLSYGEYFFAGTLAMIVMFTAIFSTITVIEDRKEGFLQGVLVAPVPRSAIALGKIAGTATLAVLHALVFLALAPLAGVGEILTISERGYGKRTAIAAYRLQRRGGRHPSGDRFGLASGGPRAPILCEYPH